MFTLLRIVILGGLLILLYAGGYIWLRMTGEIGHFPGWIELRGRYEPVHLLFLPAISAENRIRGLAEEHRRSAVPELPSLRDLPQIPPAPEPPRLPVSPP